jgi:hypothetical protein
MSPTLADVYMITGLDTTGSVYPHKYKSSSWQTRVKKQELDIRVYPKTYV